MIPAPSSSKLMASSSDLSTSHLVGVYPVISVKSTWHSWLSRLCLDYKTHLHRLEGSEEQEIHFQFKMNLEIKREKITEKFPIPKGSNL